MAQSRVGMATIDRFGAVLGGPSTKALETLHHRPGPLRLSKRGDWFRVKVAPSHRYLLTVETVAPLPADSRAGRIDYRFISWRAQLLRDADVGKAKDDGGFHDFIPRVPRGNASRYTVLTPPAARWVDVRFTANAASGQPVDIMSVSFEALGPRTEFAHYDLPIGAAPRSDLRLAVIADPFTLTALRFEANVHPLTKLGWRDELAAFRPDLLLIESAWEGNDGEWRYCVVNIKDGDRRLADLVSHARGAGVPVLFWSKEDPVHYEDFLAAARLGDVVATTDGEMIPRYVSDLGHDRVFPLPFSIQVDIHNPRHAGDVSGERLPGVGFLGSWWAAKFDERRQVQEQLLSGAAGHRLEIFDRYLAYDVHERYRFAPEWLPYVHGTLAYEQALSAYRRYAVMLNFNTVTDSPTTFSRRALEAAACGAVVVTNPSAGTEAALGDLVVSAATAEECSDALELLAKEPGERDLMAHRAYRHTHQHHSWTNRLRDIAERCNVALPASGCPKVSVVLATKRRAGADRILRYLASIDDPAVELETIVIAAFNPAELEAEAEVERLRACIVRELPDETLGDCLNRGVAMSTGSVIAKLDDDDIYGPRYLQDLYLALTYSRADIAGKQTHYVYLEAADSTIVRYPGNEHRFTRWVSGSTFLFRASVYERIQFPGRRVGEDTEFQRRAVEAGLRIFSADRYSFVSQRRADLSTHTWQEPHEKFMTSALSKFWCYGIPWDHVNA